MGCNFNVYSQMLGSLRSVTYIIEPLTIAEEISRALSDSHYKALKTRSGSLSLEFESSYVPLFHHFKFSVKLPGVVLFLSYQVRMRPSVMTQ